MNEEGGGCGVGRGGGGVGEGVVSADETPFKGMESQ